MANSLEVEIRKTNPDNPEDKNIEAFVLRVEEEIIPLEMAEEAKGSLRSYKRFVHGVHTVLIVPCLAVGIEGAYRALSNPPSHESILPFAQVIVGFGSTSTILVWSWFKELDKIKLIDQRLKPKDLEATKASQQAYSETFYNSL